MDGAPSRSLRSGGTPGYEQGWIRQGRDASSCYPYCTRVVDRFWAFECMFVVNNNREMDEVYVGESRKELCSAMKAFFSVPRARVLLADVLGTNRIELGPGWSDAKSGSASYPFDPKERFVKTFELPMV